MDKFQTLCLASNASQMYTSCDEVCTSLSQRTQHACPHMEAVRNNNAYAGMNFTEFLQRETTLHGPQHSWKFLHSSTKSPLSSHFLSKLEKIRWQVGFQKGEDCKEASKPLHSLWHYQEQHVCHKHNIKTKTTHGVHIIRLSVTKSNNQVHI